jgi:hypothetical protein
LSGTECAFFDIVAVDGVENDLVQRDIRRVPIGWVPFYSDAVVQSPVCKGERTVSNKSSRVRPGAAALEYRPYFLLSEYGLGTMSND